MIEVAVYLVIVLALAGLGVRIGMILAGRIDRHLTPPDAEAATPPPAEEPL